MRLRIAAASSAGGDPPYIIDLGQAFEFYAESVEVELLAPQGSQAIGQGTVLPSAVGLLFQAEVGVRLLRLEEHSSAAAALLTDTIFVAQREEVDVPIPCGARRLTIYGETAISPVMRWIRNAAAALAMGVVDWDPVRPRHEIDVPSASDLRISADDDTDRTFTFVWTISP